MRIPFVLCAWALLLAAPLTHGLTVRDPAKLLATPQSMRWRSDRDRATHAIHNSPLISGKPECVESPEMSPRTTWAQSQDLVEPILMKFISPPNSIAKYRVGRLEGGTGCTVGGGICEGKNQGKNQGKNNAMVFAGTLWRPSGAAFPRLA